jgi:hypothetical protein
LGSSVRTDALVIVYRPASVTGTRATMLGRAPAGIIQMG